jgi:hypothetical protein
MLIPIERYLHPEETNTEIIRLYYECLFSLTLRPRWAPVLYLVAVHHVNRFMYTQDGKHLQLKHAMLKESLRGENKVIFYFIILYVNFSIISVFSLVKKMKDVRWYYSQSYFM